MSDENNQKPIENLEYGIDSRYKSKKESQSEATLLMEARLMRMKNISKEQIIRARLMQLKLNMEEYIKQPKYEGRSRFTDFLKSYVDIVYPSRNKFAYDINVTPISLSQIINNHREPKDEFIMKLMLHSEKVYKDICAFHKENWYQVYFQEKICDTMSNQDKWRPKLEKDVKFSEIIK